MATSLFDDRFQRHFAAYLLRDTQLLSLVAKFLDPVQFSNELIRTLVLVIRTFFNEFRSAPDQMIFNYLKQLVEEKKLAPDVHQVLIPVCTDMLQEELQNREYLLGIYDTAMKHIAFDGIMPEFMEKARVGHFDVAESMLHRALTNTPKGKWSPGAWFDPDPSNRMLRRRSVENDIFPTLIPMLDQYNGYISRGEIGIIQGQRTNIGKSAMLVFLARSLIFQGKRVIIYTMEMTKEQYEDRLDMCISGLTTEGLTNTEILRQRLLRIVRDDRMLLVKDFPTYKTTVKDLQEHVNQVRDQYKFYPDCIIIDYDDLLDPGTREARSNLYLRGFEIYNAIKGWVQEERLGCWIASQSSRSATEKSTADESQMGGSKAKSEVADVILTINRTAEEEVRGVSRIFVSKHRTARARYEVSFPSDLSRMQFYDSRSMFQNG